jgi:hypothetical protein
MRDFRVTFPDRPVHEECHVKAEDHRIAWAKMHERFPFERIEVRPW